MQDKVHQTDYSFIITLISYILNIPVSCLCSAIAPLNYDYD